MSTEAGVTPSGRQYNCDDRPLGIRVREKKTHNRAQNIPPRKFTAMKKILIPIDWSENAEKAFECTSEQC